MQNKPASILVVPLEKYSAALQVNLPACSPHCLFHAERQAGKL